ncbi:MAG: hypothetical protein ACK5D8_04300 [Bacteroidota bacterium]|jgi:hypothetical protein
MPQVVMQNNQQVKKTKRGSRVWLPLFFIVPAALCLLFYVFYIRKPFTQLEKPVFISLKHYGKFLAIENGDSVFTSLPELKGELSNGDTFSSSNKFIVIHLLPSLDRKVCAMAAANLFRIQKRISHIKPLKMLSLPDTTDARSLLKRYRNETHAEGKKWDYLYLEDAQRKELKNALQLISGITADSLYMHLFLVDHHGMLRGIYEASSVVSVNNLMNEIVVLNGEYKFNMNHHENSSK